MKTAEFYTIVEELKNIFVLEKNLKKQLEEIRETPGGQINLTIKHQTEILTLINQILVTHEPAKTAR